MQAKTQTKPDTRTASMRSPKAATQPPAPPLPVVPTRIPPPPAGDTPWKPLPKGIVDNGSISRLILKRSGVLLVSELRHLPAKLALILAHSGVMSVAQLSAIDTATFRRTLPAREQRDAVRRAFTLADLPVPSAFDFHTEGPF